MALAPSIQQYSSSDYLAFADNTLSTLSPAIDTMRQDTFAPEPVLSYLLKQVELMRAFKKALERIKNSFSTDEAPESCLKRFTCPTVKTQVMVSKRPIDRRVSRLQNAAIAQLVEVNAAAQAGLCTSKNLFLRLHKLSLDEHLSELAGEDPHLKVAPKGPRHRKSIGPSRLKNEAKPAGTLGEVKQIEGDSPLVNALLVMSIVAIFFKEVLPAIFWIYSFL